MTYWGRKLLELRQIGTLCWHQDGSGWALETSSWRIKCLGSETPSQQLDTETEPSTSTSNLSLLDMVHYSSQEKVDF